MIISNHLFSNVDLYHKVCWITLELANILFKRFILFPDNRFHKRFTKWNTSLQLTFPCMGKTTSGTDCATSLACITFISFSLLVISKICKKWLYLSLNHSTGFHISSAFRAPALWSLLKIFTPLVNPVPLLAEMMLLCYPAPLSLTYFHLAREISW